MAPWFNSTQELSGSHAHTILIQNYVIGFHLNFPQSLPIGPMVYVFLAQHSSSCNQFSPIMWPCTWWALAHTSWMKMLREILLCTIPVLPLSHCLQISVKIKKKKKIHKCHNTIIQPPHSDPECCWKEHHVQPCKYKSLQETRRALKLPYSNMCGTSSNQNH